MMRGVADKLVADELVADKPTAGKVVVRFAGEGSGTGPLTWGQDTVWRGIVGAGSTMWLTGVRELPAGTSVEDVADSLSFLMGRHQSLRTRLLMPEGEPVQQVVSSSGEVTIDVLDVADDADPLAVAKELQDGYLESELDYAADFPVRMTVVRHQGQARYRVMAMCHLVSDGFGVQAMLADLAARDPVTGEPSGPVTATQPLEQASWQQSPAGQRRSMTAERYWQRLLRAIPVRRFPAPDTSQPQRCGRVTFGSRAAYLAIRAIAARADIDTSPVLLAAFAVALARTTGINPVVPRIYVNNRFRAGLADTVSPIAQTCPCIIDVAGITFDEAVQRAYYAGLSAYKNAYFQPRKIRRLVYDVSQERGVEEEIDVSLVYNDRRMESPRTADGAIAEPDELRAAVLLHTLSWEDTPEAEDDCHIHVLDSPDTINVMVVTDSHYVARDDVEAFLYEMEAVAVAAALDPAATTGV
jgi:hypothetical protein